MQTWPAHRLWIPLGTQSCTWTQNTVLREHGSQLLLGRVLVPLGKEWAPTCWPGSSIWDTRVLGDLLRVLKVEESVGSQVMWLRPMSWVVKMVGLFPLVETQITTCRGNKASQYHVPHSSTPPEGTLPFPGRAKEGLSHQVPQGGGSVRGRQWLCVPSSLLSKMIKVIFPKPQTISLVLSRLLTPLLCCLSEQLILKS